MYSFLISVLALIAGYFIYGKFVERVFSPDFSRPTPAITNTDGVDYVPMPTWKVFMIQFLNIAGTGPIFGAIMGAKFGPSAYLWIVFGCIFAGAVHDYILGMLSVRNSGAGLPEIVGMYLGNGVKKVMLVFALALLLLVGAVFVYSPAVILADITSDGGVNSMMMWIGVIFLYYIMACLLPIDKIVGKIYPIFAFALLFMAVSLMVCLIIKWPSLPEFWDGLVNLGQQRGLIKGQEIFPCLFITIACGAVSGFHATQSPLMAKCMQNEKFGRPVFYGAMITEGLVALIWAAISSYFFFDSGAEAVGSTISASAPVVVGKVSFAWLGLLGGILALLGVVCAPITSGDTAFRSARLILADFLHIDQQPKRNRIIISLPLFLVAGLLLWYNVADENGFNTIWRYFGWANQTLAVFSFWTATVYLTKTYKDRRYLVTLIPSAFMTAVCLTYICIDKIGFNLPSDWNYAIGLITFVLSIDFFYVWKIRRVNRKSLKY